MAEEMVTRGEALDDVKDGEGGDSSHDVPLDKR